MRYDPCSETDSVGPQFRNALLDHTWQVIRVNTELVLPGLQDKEVSRSSSLLLRCLF